MFSRPPPSWLLLLRSLSSCKPSHLLQTLSLQLRVLEICEPLLLGVFRGVESNPGVLHSYYFNFIIMLTEEKERRGERRWRRPVATVSTTECWMTWSPQVENYLLLDQRHDRRPWDNRHCGRGAGGEDFGPGYGNPSRFSRTSDKWIVKRISQ